MLRIRVYDKTLSNESGKAGTEKLKTMILNEINRVKKLLTYEESNTFWTRNMFDGIELCSCWYDNYWMRFPLPTQAVIAGKSGAVWEIT